MNPYPFGVFGLGVMGSSLAQNFRRNGIPAAVYNHTWDLTHKLLHEAGPDPNLFGARTLYEFVSALERPRRILLMVTAGVIVDKVIARLKPHLQPGDIIIDGGNSHFQDTERRIAELEGTGIQFVGMGVSGGEHGALWGPSLMPGGEEGVYRYLEPYLTRIAAKADDKAPCVAYIGKAGAGHFVKMVHNGIEYGDMQLISEAYDLLRNGLGLSPDELADTFSDWNRGELSSYLIEITAKIVNFPDQLTGEGILLDKILDKAGMKGTGTWTGTAALNLGEPIPTIIGALHARALSSLTEQRRLAQSVYHTKIQPLLRDKERCVEKIRAAVYVSKICSYAQGFDLMRVASQEYGYGLKLSDIAGIWRGGCIMRAAFLDKIRSAFEKNPALLNLLLDDGFAEEIRPRVEAWREVVSAGVGAGIPIPAMSASLAYFDALRRDRLPAHLIQAQRDFFGAHTYQRIDRPGTFHTEWE